MTAASYVTLQSAADKFYAHGRHYYSKSGFYNRVDPKLPQTMLEYFVKNPVPKASVSAAAHGGKGSRIAESATAYAHRDALYQISISADWDEAADGQKWMKYCRDYWTVLAPLSDGGFYINQTTDEGENEIRKNYRGNYDRLARVKAQYDPENVFRVNQNIVPAT